MCKSPVRAAIWLLFPLCSRDTVNVADGQGYVGTTAPKTWTSNPVARHISCSVVTNTPTLCTLVGDEVGRGDMEYYIQTLPTQGQLYETSSNHRAYWSDPKNAPDPIGPHQLPFHVTDPLHRVVYVPPWNAWPPEGRWASFTYTVTAPTCAPGICAVSWVPLGHSEVGMVVLSGEEGHLAVSLFDVAGESDDWKVTGNLAGIETGSGLKHQAFVFGGLSHYIFGVDEVQYLDFTTGLDRSKWYFEASPSKFYQPELAAAYGGQLRFTVKALYGNFTMLNAPLDWVTLDCASCHDGHGLRLVRSTDDILNWDGREQAVSLTLSVAEPWFRDPLNSAEDFAHATQCEVAAVLHGLTRLAILGDFTRGGEGVALDNVEIIAAPVQPAMPVQCQAGCICVHNPDLIYPWCC